MKKSIAIFFLIFVLIPAHGYALAGDWQKDDAVGVRLISGVDGVGQEKTIPLGLEVQLGSEWHTYWRSPGMAGLPPQIDWQNSLNDAGNVESATLLYPAPKRYTAYGLETIGYRDHIIFPIDAQVKVPGHALTIDATLNILVCSAICVPKTFPLKLTVPEGPAAVSAEAPLLKQFRDQVPADSAKSGLVLQDIANNGNALTITFESRDTLTQPDIFIEDDKDISFGAPEVTLGEQNRQVRFTVKPADTLPDGITLAGMALTLTVVDSNFALEQKVTAPPIITTGDGKSATVVVPPNDAAPGDNIRPPLSFGFVILLALLGGFILNLMPCVLPVLSMKILSVISHGGGEKRVVRHSFLVTAAGVVFSYLALGGTTILLRQLGLAFGWGVQFQQPMFLAMLILLLTFFAANMWDLLEIQLPRFLADNLDPAYHPKLAGDFLTGAFATLLATPCSAPFLGTAVGFALASNAYRIIVVFLALGIGMSLPYFAIAIWPGFATSLPKPGAWMVRLRHILGTALGLTALWLIWILMSQVPQRFAVLVGLCMVGTVILLMMRKTSVSPKLTRAGLSIFAAVALSVTFVGSLAPKDRQGSIDRMWIPLDQAAIAADLDEGKVVFLDISADWCLTCKANMRFVLMRDPVAQKLFHSDVIAMQGDWTNPDPAITAFLHKYGRYGIPFNIVFGPGAPQGIVLPELLSASAIMDALAKAGKAPGPE